MLILQKLYSPWIHVLNNEDCLKIDFSKNTLAYRVSQLRGTNELIAKAIGYKAGMPVTVFDTTAGLGVEAFLLAALGCQVTLFERHPLVADALSKALNDAKQDLVLAPIIAKMDFHPECAINYFKQHLDCFPDVIYCDPMFAPRKKSAAVKQSMKMLQTLVGQDSDATDLVDIALQRARKRVVVKSARHAPPLHANPTFSLHARAHRFDVYAFNRV